MNYHPVRQAQYKKGFVVPLFLALVALLLIGGGAYVYVQKKQENPPVTGNATLPQTTSTIPTIKQTTSTAQTSNSQTNTTTPVSVSGMSKYTDTDFGFSFWYPTSGSVQNIAVSNPNRYPGGIVLKELMILASTDTHGQKFTIEEYNSPDRTITDPVLGCPMGNCADTTRYYFDVNNGTWMVEYPNGIHSDRDGTRSLSPVTRPANVSINTMGGLHILAGTGHWDSDVIIPLSAHHFLIVSSASQPGTFASGDQNYLVNTIVATDSAVATPISVAEQIKRIKLELDAYVVKGDSFSASLTSGVAPLAVHFSIPSQFSCLTESLSCAAHQSTYIIDYGDGMNSLEGGAYRIGSNLDHTYATTGIYTATLTDTTDNKGTGGPYPVIGTTTITVTSILK